MGWLSKAWGGIKKGAEIGSLIPGVNVVAGPLAAGMNLAQAGKNISQGNWKGALGSTLRGLPGAASIPGVGGAFKGVPGIAGGFFGGLEKLPGNPAGIMRKAAGAYKNLPGWGKELGKFAGIAGLSALGSRGGGGGGGGPQQMMGGPTQGRLKGLYGQQFAGGGWIYPGMDGGGVITTLGDTPSGEEFVIPEDKYMEYMRRVQEERDIERAVQDSAWAEALQETPTQAPLIPQQRRGGVHGPFQGGAYAAQLPRFQRGGSVMFGQKVIPAYSQADRTRSGEIPLTQFLKSAGTADPAAQESLERILGSDLYRVLQPYNPNSEKFRRALNYPVGSTPDVTTPSYYAGEEEWDAQVLPRQESLAPASISLEQMMLGQPGLGIDPAADPPGYTPDDPEARFIAESSGRDYVADPATEAESARGLRQLITGEPDPWGIKPRRYLTQEEKDLNTMSAEELREKMGETEGTGLKGFLKKYGPEMLIAGGMLGGSLFGGDKYQVNRPNRRFPTRAAAGAIVDTNGSPLQALVAEAGEREFVGDFPAVRDQLGLERNEIPRVLSMPQLQGGGVAGEELTDEIKAELLADRMNTAKTISRISIPSLRSQLRRKFDRDAGKNIHPIAPYLNQILNMREKSGGGRRMRLWEDSTVAPSDTLGVWDTAMDKLNLQNSLWNRPSAPPDSSSLPQLQGGAATYGTGPSGYREVSPERSLFNEALADEAEQEAIEAAFAKEAHQDSTVDNYWRRIKERMEWDALSFSEKLATERFKGSFPGRTLQGLKGLLGLEEEQTQRPPWGAEGRVAVPTMQGGGIATGGSPLEILRSGLKDAVINSIDDPNRQGKNSFVPAMLKAYDEINKFKGAGIPQFQAGAQITGANPNFVDPDKQAQILDKQSQPGYFENLQGPQITYGARHTRTGTPGSGGLGGEYTGDLQENLFVPTNPSANLFADPATDSVTGTKGSELATVPNFNARNIAQNISSAYSNMAAARGQTGRFDRAGQVDDRYNRAIHGAFADRALQEAASNRADYGADLQGWQAQDASDRGWANLGLGAEQARGPGLGQNIANLGMAYLANR